MMAKYQLLSGDTCDRFLEVLKNASWETGISPVKYPPGIKCNLEIVPEVEVITDAILGEITDSIMRCQFFIDRTMPKLMASPRFDLYRDGGEYRNHSDPAFIGGSIITRTDLTVTVFLSDPKDYEGGELVLEYPSGAVMEVKEPKGVMIFYPSGVMQRVNPVTSGVRIAFTAWVESHIQDPQKRGILTEINAVCNQLETLDNINDIHTKLSNITSNLYRQWMITA